VLSPRLSDHGGLELAEVTYIAAFRGLDSVVFGADTQETIGGHKVYTEKLKTIEAPWGAIVIGGAGNGELCDGFSQAIEDETKSLKPSSIADIEIMVKTVLQTFYAQDVAYEKPKNRAIKFVIGASLLSSQVSLWRTAGQRLISIPKFAIIGFDAPIYKYFAKRLQQFSDYPSQTVLVMAYLIGIAKETGQAVGGKSHITVLRSGRAFPESDEYITSITGRIDEFYKIIDRLFFLSMDLAVNEDGFRGVMKQVGDLLLMLRQKHAYEAAQLSVKLANDPSWKGDPYPKLVPGSLTIVANNISFTTDRDFLTERCDPAERGSIPSVLTFEAERPQPPETRKYNRQKSSKRRGA
jgi:hypothetical protein